MKPCSEAESTKHFEVIDQSKESPVLPRRTHPVDQARRGERWERLTEGSPKGMGSRPIRKQRFTYDHYRNCQTPTTTPAQPGISLLGLESDLGAGSLGADHLIRATILNEEFWTANWRVCFVYGPPGPEGMPLDLQLPDANGSLLPSERAAIARERV